MTRKAREVLEDCKVAVAQLRDGVSGREWRIAWVTAVALLRAVGHVLRNVDAEASPTHAQVIDSAWEQLNRSKPDPIIFWDFIEAERNNILKEYRLSAGQGVTIRVGVAHIDLRTGEQWGEPGEPPLYHYEMNSGPFKGTDQRVVLNQAIQWWDQYLGHIERELQQTP